MMSGSTATKPQGFFHRRRVPLLCIAVLVLGFALYAYRVRSNPPGFYVDESSIAYNAHTISQTGRDEFGNQWPLFFRAFGDYKNPVHIYLLAALFKLTGPSVLTARLLSSAAGVAAALVLGLLAARISKHRMTGFLVAVSALLTPWLFELSRVVVEVALYPLVVALFLVAVRRAHERSVWSWPDAVILAATLALVTYTYSIGRLLGPLFALGLVVFITRERLSGLMRTWGLYLLTLVPMFAFQRLHAEALTARFNLISYVRRDSSITEIISEFARHYAGNLNPWRMIVTGDPNIYQMASLHGAPLVLMTTFFLALAGAALVLLRHRRDPWWRFIFFGLAASIVPASLTLEYFHMLRLSPLLVFLLLLTAPAIDWFLAEGKRQRARRAALVFVMALTTVEGAYFQKEYHANAQSPRRVHMFEAGFPQVIFPAALAYPARPIYIADAAPTGYVQTYWHAGLNGVPLSEFVMLAPDESPPMGAVVITTEENCPRCRVLAHSDPYTVYVADRPPRIRAPLPENGFRAEIRAPEPPALMRAGEKEVLRVRVKNTSEAAWLARERNAGRLQVHLGSRWLDLEGRDLGRSGRSAILEDIHPGEETELKLAVDTPRQAGEYVLELDMVQEGVAWFAPKGSQPLRLRVRVE